MSEMLSDLYQDMDGVTSDASSGIEGEQKPDEGEQKSDEGEQNPDEGEQNPDEGEQNPDEGEQNPDEGEKKSTEDNSVIRGMRRKIRELEKQLKAQASPPPPLPTRDDFYTEEEYMDAVVDYKIDQRMQASTASNPNKSVEVKINEAKAGHPDFDEVRERFIDEGIQVSTAHQEALVQAVSTLKYGGEMYYRLAKDLDFASEIALLPPAAFAARLGELHGMIVAEKKARQPVASKTQAPPPITPAVPSSSHSVDPAKMTMEEYMKWRAKNMET